MKKTTMKNGLVKKFKFKKRKCVILWIHNHFSAYVETKLKRVEYQDFDYVKVSPESNIEAHGGITFSGELEILKDKIWYFGCDYSYLGDYCKGMPSYFNRTYEGKPAKKWSLKEVEKETKDMVKSIIEYEEFYKKYKKKFNKSKKEFKK